MFLTGFALRRAKLLGGFRVLEVKLYIIFSSSENEFKLCSAAVLSSFYGAAVPWDEEHDKYNGVCSVLL